MTIIRPQPLPVRRTPPFLAAYWADVDTTPRNGGNVFYRATTNQALLDRASDHITELLFVNHNLSALIFDQNSYAYKMQFFIPGGRAPTYSSPPP